MEITEKGGSKVKMEEKEKVGIGDPFKPILIGGLSAEDLLSPANS